MKNIWQGWIIAESLQDPEILKDFKVIKKQSEENSEGAETRIWNLYTVEIEDEQIESVADKLSQTIKPEYYLHLTNKQELILVLAGQYFRLNVVSCGQEKEFGLGDFVTDQAGREIWQQAVDYAVNQAGLDQRYLINVK